ncbi:MAG TPA: GWxTD domain-containing protein [Ignavibacteriaceae bacterium]|nr:GWxTD domain-containing protein [Ignavibacteriaceae bacterium]
MKTLSLLLFLSISLTTAQQKLNFDFDFAQFAFDSSSNYLEFYYSFGQEGLTHTQTDSSFLIEGILGIEVTDTISHTTIVKKEWKINHEVKDTTEIDKSLVGVVSFIIPAGEYICKVSGRNFKDSLIIRKYEENIKIVPFIGNTISISNIQIASNILQDSPNKNSVFYKNSFEIIPIPTSIFGENLPVLFHYFELYNLDKVSSDSPLKLNTFVYNSRKELFFTKSKILTKNVNSRVEVGTVPVNKFPTDTYTLAVSLIDSIGNYGVSSSKKFYVLNPSILVNDSDNTQITSTFATHFGVMSEEELDDLFVKSKYIATNQEIEQYNSLSSKEGKQKFLSEFWNMRDSEPSTPRNEFYFEYLKRIEKSNKDYGALGKKGWQTDRGRILLKYGDPSEIERFPNQIDTKPYEIWYYNEFEGGVIFIFGDITNFSDYQLIHSTARGELRDDSWERRIRSI